MDKAPGIAVGPRSEPVGEPFESRREERVREPSDEPEQPDAASPRGPVAAAVADRLPLAVRPLVESLPAGVRRGRLGLQPSHALIIILVVLLGVAATALLAGLGRPKVSAVQPAATATVLATGTPVAEPEPAGDGGAPAAESGAAAGESTVVVHVVGKVASPGIVELPAGSRVVDALEAVGGPDDGVDLSTLNLARVVGDGEQVFVGVDPPPQAVPPAEPGDGTPTRVNLNTATADQLETLPGIGPTLAGRILEWRERNGRFTAPEELLEVSGIGPATFEAMADLVTL